MEPLRRRGDLFEGLLQVSVWRILSGAQRFRRAGRGNFGLGRCTMVKLVGAGVEPLRRRGDLFEGLLQVSVWRMWGTGFSVRGSWKFWASPQPRCRSPAALRTPGSLPRHTHQLDHCAPPQPKISTTRAPKTLCPTQYTPHRHLQQFLKQISASPQRLHASTGLTYAPTHANHCSAPLRGTCPDCRTPLQQHSPRHTDTSIGCTTTPPRPCQTPPHG